MTISDEKKLRLAEIALLDASHALGDFPEVAERARKSVRVALGALGWVSVDQLQLAEIEALLHNSGLTVKKGADAMTEWQPIETAAKRYGPDVLLWNGLVVFVGWYSDTPGEEGWYGFPKQ